LASHDLKIVNELCDEALLLNGGRVLAFGKTKEVIGSYLKLLEK
jgi:ABC-type polysaccharide/polyol phosphate transport system ATPase subunit